MVLLHIYDSSDSGIAGTVAARTDAGRVLLPISAGGGNLISSLDGLVSSNQSFNRILFETHGSPGRIYFGGAYIDAAWITSNMSGRNYDLICPNSTRIYFNGCNVAAESAGSNFLRAVASVFLRRSGGTIFGHTSLGWEVPLYSAVTGHVVHFAGELKTAYVAAGGTVTEETVQSDI